MPADWERTFGTPQLRSGEVQVWRIDLAEEDGEDTSYRSVLSTKEIERAGRLRAGQVRMQFLAGRSCVRSLLGAHLGIPPNQVPIVTTEYGKPDLASPYTGKVHFNVTHSRSTVLLALNLDAPVGIDIEYLDRSTDVAEVARHSLTEPETANLLSIDDAAERSRYFFDRWTKKEAIVKADGRGLSLALTSFEVPLDIESQSTPLTILNEDQMSQRDYYVCALAFDQEAVCAVAIADQPYSLRLLRFPPFALIPT